VRLRIWSRRIGLAGALGIVIALCAVVAWTFALSWRPSDIYHFQGVDVSEAQGPIEWWTVKAGGADFAYLRATRGALELGSHLLIRDRRRLSAMPCAAIRIDLRIGRLCQSTMNFAAVG